MGLEKAVCPLVTVITPAYNAERFIKETLDSVLVQSMENWEMIVIDDGSTDRTREIVAEYAKTDTRIRLIENENNMGVARTRNRGIDMAQGEYVAFLDSDDTWHPHKLSAQIDKITAEDAQICYCSYAIVGPQGSRVRADYLVSDSVVYEYLLRENCMQCSAMLIRTDTVRQVMFNTEYYHEDYILGLDMLRQGYRAVGCTEILLNWRYIENSRSFNKWNAAKNRWRIYRYYLNLPLLEAASLFFSYTMAGLRKYVSKAK